MSEDAQESRNKDIKKYRENFSRKSSRLLTMKDVFNRLLVTSDPLISSKGTTYPKIGKRLSAEAVKLLSNLYQQENININNSATTSDDDEDSE